MILREGLGWRLAWEPSRGQFTVLVGGENWAFELTEFEWRDLVGLVSTLETQYCALKDQLMVEESIELELERGEWWGCLAGDCQSWSLALVLTPRQGRGAEGFWPAPVAVAVVAAMKTLCGTPRID
ncbi:DUF1818 family protein [Synechococcus sp. M16CYN]|uniref:DUF1818 family protein n=1 Tax=Synechococcus sp. M16CYN TaxID=3103139 RepID=UPI003250D9B4